jgi:integrase
MVARQGARRVRLHDLRRGWATMALKAGVHPKVVQERLGHANVGVTLNIYSHTDPELRAGAAERVASLVFGA